MSPNILLFYRLLKDVREGLELLYDVSLDSGCPYISDLKDSFSAYNRFFDSCSKDFKAYDGNSSTSGTN